MFDILFYVIENYLPESRPEPRALACKLTAVGFAEDDIAAALGWLQQLDALAAVQTHGDEVAAGGLRLYDRRECDKLDVEARRLLLFLEQAGAIDGATRELIIDGAMVLPGDEVDGEALRFIVLMVLWRQRIAMEPLILEELLTGGGGEQLSH